MRLLETRRFRKSRAHLLKRLKQNVDNPEKYMYYFNKMQSLYLGYKKYTEEETIKKMNDFLKSYGLKLHKFYYEEELEKAMGNYKQEVEKSVLTIVEGFKKLQADYNKKLTFFNKKLNHTLPQSNASFTVS